jgi:dipeptidyl aminopeptidase/acylaminoacyl peptidase
VENSLRFVAALQKVRVPFDFHVYQKGGHGIGLGDGRKGNTTENAHPWAKDLIFWMRQNDWVK